MNEELYEAIRPVVTVRKPSKEGNFLIRFLSKHPNTK